MDTHPSRREQMKLLLSPRRSSPASPRPAGSTAVANARRVHGAAAATRILTRPRWLVFHVVIAALAVTFVLLGRWQLDVSNAKHFDFFNFQYAVQWWLFAAFGLFLWIRIMRNRLNPPAPVPARAGIVLAPDGATALPAGSTMLVAPGTMNDDRPVIYRGYVTPQSSRAPVRSHGDTVHDAYNDYLWQLGVVDGAIPDVFAQPGALFDDDSIEESDPGPAGRELH